eukprot:5166950-Prymnesium_polylepis.1
MPDEVAHKWVCSLRALLRMLPRFASPAHWRWAQFCMAAARASDTSGLLSPADLPSLMKCANTSFPHYKQGRIAAEIQSSSSRRSSRRSIKRLSQALAEEATSLDFPAFCNAPHNRLAAWQVTGLLVEQSALSDEISYQFARFATNGKLQLAGWLRFVRAGQLTAHGDDGAAELDCEQRCFEAVSKERLIAGVSLRSEEEGGEAGEGLSQLQFALLLLCPRNDAVAAGRVPQMKLLLDDSKTELGEPLTLYWSACSHNSCTADDPRTHAARFAHTAPRDLASHRCMSDIVGDQLTGFSSANAYRRQLLQVLHDDPFCKVTESHFCPAHHLLEIATHARHLEIDCWDGSGRRGPVVTHGRTFCTVESFVEVAKAIAECAFTNSELPVILSLEMHCTPGQQFRLAKLMTEHLSNSRHKLQPIPESEQARRPTRVVALSSQYQDLIDTGRPVLLSPLDLKRRVLLKGKIKLQSKRSRSLSNTFIRARLESNSGRARSLSDCRKQSKTGGGGARTVRKSKSFESKSHP